MTLLYDHRLEPYGLTVTQFSLLAHLRSRDDGISIGALANNLIMDPTALARALKPLERSGLVSVTAPEMDKRARHVRLTSLGHETYSAARVGWRAAQDHVDGVLRGQDLQALNPLLDLLIEAMKSERLPDPPASALAAKDSP